MTNASTMCVKTQKNVSNGMKIAITNHKNPIPNQVKNNMAIVLVRKLMPVNPNDIILPLCVTTYNPTKRCNRFNIIGASMPNKI